MVWKIVRSIRTSVKTFSLAVHIVAAILVLGLGLLSLLFVPLFSYRVSSNSSMILQGLLPTTKENLNHRRVQLRGVK